jgi:carboxyl-terminal processing protease
VNVSVLRADRKDLLDFSIVVDKAPVNSIDAFYMVAPKIGYIKFARFSRTSMNEFRSSVSHLQEQGMKDLILDLRGNSIGLINLAVDLSDYFIAEGKLIVYREIHEREEEYLASKNSNFDGGRIIVLINEGSSSGSEIVSGAIQDWDRGLVVGRRPFGRGHKLSDGTSVVYYTPTGRRILKPYEEGMEEYYKDLENRLDRGELVDAKTIEIPDSLKYFTPNGRVMYGGGGIMPDVYVSLDSTRFSVYYSDLVRKGIFNTFSINYLDKNRIKIQKEYSDFKLFKDKFEVTDEIFDEFLALAYDKGVERKPDDMYFYPITDLKIQIKAMIARNLWNVNAYFQVINILDNELKVAVALMQDGTIFSDLNIH